MEHFYDGQVKRYLTQFMRVMSNFSYKDAKGNLTRVPVRYGDMNRQVAAIISKNSENIVQSAPFIACYIKDLQFDRDRLQDPTYVSKVQVRERSLTPDGKEYLNTQGANYTVERIMPTPYTATFQADIWTTNTDQKLQLWEQIVILFNPALEIQSTDNYLDWTSLSYLELTQQTFETRTVPQGLEADISIANLTFTAPIWITPPAKVKKLGIVTKIIANVFTDAPGTIAGDSYKDLGLADLFSGRVAKAKTVVTPGNYDLLVLNNVATLLPIKESNITNADEFDNITRKGNWKNLLDLYPGEFIAGISQIRLTKSDGKEIVAYVTLNPIDEFSMVLNIDPETIDPNTLIVSENYPSGYGRIDAIINPQTFNTANVVVGTRYLIIEDTVTGTESWGDFVAVINDIIEWNGTNWTIIFNSQEVTTPTYITNSYTGIQYKWDGVQWSKSFEGVYDRGAWRLIL